MKMPVVILSLFAVATFADDNSTNSASAFQREIERHHEIALKQEPIGSKTSWSVITNTDNQIVFHFYNDISGSNWIVYGGPVPISFPHTFIETNSGISFLVESDGRHITASGQDGRIFWRTDPFADAHLEFYRTKNPQIIYIGKANKRTEEYWLKKDKRFIGILYNSSQFGELDIKTGEFFLGGQD
jgi:hypothetical protein